MSASLVGSEMCIRDRGPNGMDMHIQAVRQRILSQRGWPTAIGRGRGRAVSYTHLTLPTICSV
eukprot:13784616-Alexandrium_andersonii.AAC.1